jgi:hypothetical protein
MALKIVLAVSIGRAIATALLTIISFAILIVFAALVYVVAL